MLIDSRFNEERAIKLDYFWRNSTVEDVQLHKDAVELSVVKF